MFQFIPEKWIPTLIKKRKSSSRSTLRQTLQIISEELQMLPNILKVNPPYRSELEPGRIIPIHLLRAILRFSLRFVSSYWLQEGKSKEINFPEKHENEL